MKEGSEGIVMMIQTLKLLFFVCAILLWYAGLCPAQPLFGPTQDPLAGSRIFGEKGCSKCHAIFGVGGKSGPDLAHVPRARSFYELGAAMWNHLPKMTEQMRKAGIARPYLSPSETGDLIAFLYTVNYFEPAADPKQGRQVFMQKQCVTCHQVGGIGGVIGPSLDSLGQYVSPIFFAAAMWNHGPSMAEAMRARGIERPSFNEAEFRSLIGFIRSSSPLSGKEPLYILPGRPSQGQSLFAQKGCIECHSVKGRGGQAGGELAQREIKLNMVQFVVSMWNKAPAMIKEMAKRKIALPQLQPAEMADIIAYLYSVQYFAKPGDPRRGQQLAASKGCLSCHSVAGKGGKVGPDFERTKELDQPVTVIAAMWNHASGMEEKMREKSITWPVFTEQEMGDLVAYLQSVAAMR
jgi:mono/diheme cytochrome c family protein